MAGDRVQELLKELFGQLITGKPDHVLKREAAAEIMHLQQYAQHWPTCTAVSGRLAGVVAMSDLRCSCGLGLPSSESKEIATT